MDPLISVIVPIYNAENYLTECIKSIQDQTYRKLQIILVDDGSTDNSLEICKHFANEDPRIAVINKPNSGVSSARNKGIEVAQGEYIGFVDSDDYIDKEMYEILVKRIQESDADLCALMAHTIKPVHSKVSKSNTLMKYEAIRELFLLRFPSSLWAYLYKKDLIQNLRLNKDIHFFEDFEFNYRVLKSTEKIALCHEILYHYRIHNMSTNNQSINYKRMTCLDIYDIHKRQIKNSNCELDRYALFFRSHFMVSVIISISKSSSIKEEYLKISIEKIKDMSYEVFISKQVPLYYKAAILLFSISPSLFKIVSKLIKNVAAH